jgi:hypothetical protein
MSLKRFIKFFAVALASQIFFLFGGYMLLFGPSGEERFRNSLLLYVYNPFIEAVIRAGGYAGESSMIWPPVYGTLLGIFIYSVLSALAITFLMRKRA